MAVRDYMAGLRTLKYTAEGRIIDTASKQRDDRNQGLRAEASQCGSAAEEPAGKTREPGFGQP